MNKEGIIKIMLEWQNYILQIGGIHWSTQFGKGN
jgi:hypothetical protein